MPLAQKGTYEGRTILLTVNIVNIQQVKEMQKHSLTDIRALLDTGASCTCISQSIAEKINLSMGDMDSGVPVGLATGKAMGYQSEFGVMLGNFYSNCYGLILPELQPDVIIGMDILKQCTTTIGNDGSYSISF